MRGWEHVEEEESSREKVNFLISAQNDSIKTIYIKVKIYKEHISKFWLCDERDETVNLIISEWGELAQMEKKSRRDWVEKEIHWELRKILNFDHANKGWMHKSECIRKSQTCKILWDKSLPTTQSKPARKRVCRRWFWSDAAATCICWLEIAMDK